MRQEQGLGEAAREELRHPEGSEQLREWGASGTGEGAGRPSDPRATRDPSHGPGVFTSCRWRPGLTGSQELPETPQGHPLRALGRDVLGRGPPIQSHRRG